MEEDRGTQLTAASGDDLVSGELVLIAADAICHPETVHALWPRWKSPGY